MMRICHSSPAPTEPKVRSLGLIDQIERMALKSEFHKTKGCKMSGFTTDIYPRVIVDNNGQHDFQTLSPRELDVLQELVDGKGSVEGAASLYISRHTFRTHVKSIYRKTGTHSAIEAVSMGVSLGMRPTRLSAAA